MTWHRKLAAGSPRGTDKMQLQYRMGHLQMLKICLFAVLFISLMVTFFLIIISETSWHSARRTNDSEQFWMKVKVADQAVQSVRQTLKEDTASKNRSQLKQKVVFEHSTSRVQLKQGDGHAAITKAPIQKHHSLTEMILLKKNASRMTVNRKMQSKKLNQTLSVQQHRQETLRQACDGVFHIPVMDLSKIVAPLSAGFRGTVSSNTLVNDDFNLTVTVVSEVGSSYWRKFMLDLRRMSSQKFRDKWPSSWGLDKRTDPEAKNCLRHYTKVLFVRNPLVRLLQAFRHNFINPRSVFYMKKAKTIINAVRETWEANGAVPNLSFLEFLEYLVADTKHSVDLHLRPIFQTTKPCVVPYDFIGKMETLAEDTDYLINKLGLKDRMRFKYIGPEPGTESTAVARKYYSDIPPDVVEKVREMYQEDFIAFDYPLPDFSNLTAYFETS